MALTYSESASKRKNSTKRSKNSKVAMLGRGGYGAGSMVKFKKPVTIEVRGKR